MAGSRSNWKQWSAWILVFSLPLKWLWWVVEKLGDLDFVVTRIKDPGWIGTLASMFHGFVSVPELVTFAVGVLWLTYLHYKSGLPTSAGSAQDGERGRLTIHSAMYGLGPEYELDITARVQALVKNGELHVYVWPDDLGVRPDLYEGKPKTLRVRYSYDGKEVKEIARRDMQYLHIPQRDRE